MTIPRPLSPQRPSSGSSNAKFESRDLMASLVVFLVAVPLSLGIALASGAPILAGLIGAAVGGIVVGLLGGAPLQVSGPAAGLTVIVYGIIQQFGWAAAGAVFAIAGAIQLAFGFLKVARVALAISPAVVHGMLAGIGVVIALAQLHVVLGGKPESHALVNLRELPGQILDLHSPSAVLGVVAISILLGWNYVPKPLKKVPGPLVAVAVPTLLALMPWAHEVTRVQLPSELIPKIGLPAFEMAQIGAILVAALTVAIVASVESLLSAVATDAMHAGPRAKLDRELVGQGVANLLSGLLGGLPVTGVIVRSSANIAAGARSRWSAVLHGVWIIVFAAVGTVIIEAIPLSVLAGLLVYVGIRLVNMHHIQELRKHRELPVYLVTLAGVVGKDLLFGVAAGIVLALGTLVWRMAHVRIRRSEDEEGIRVAVDGSLTFLSVPKLTAELDELPDDRAIAIDMHTDFMDHAAFEALHKWVRARETKGQAISVVEHHDDWYSLALSAEPKRRKSSLVPDSPSDSPADPRSDRDFIPVPGA